MKITAEFETVDDAEFAAAAVRHLGDGIFSVNIREIPTNARRDGDFAPVAFFTNLNTGTAVSMPIATGGVTSDVNYIGKSAVLEVICRPSETKKVVSAVVSRGGRSVTSK